MENAAARSQDDVTRAQSEALARLEAHLPRRARRPRMLPLLGWGLGLGGWAAVLAAHWPSPAIHHAVASAYVVGALVLVVALARLESPTGAGLDRVPRSPLAPKRSVDLEPRKQRRHQRLAMLGVALVSLLLMGPWFMVPAARLPLANLLAWGVASTGAAWVVTAAWRRLSDLLGAGLGPQGDPAWRRRASRRVYQAARGVIEAAGGRASVEGLFAAGDRDMHVRLTGAGWCLDVYADALLLTAPGHVKDADDAWEARATSSWRFSWSSKLESGEAARRAWSQIESLRRDDEATHRGLHGPPEELDQIVDLTARDPAKRLVRWRAQEGMLRIATPGEAEVCIDLTRPFRLFLGRSSELEPPALLLTVRQTVEPNEPGAGSGGDDAPRPPGATPWTEARLHVPLRAYDARLRPLEQMQLNAPEITEPTAFRRLWTVLYWAQRATGAIPPELPELALADGAPVAWGPEVTELHLPLAPGPSQSSAVSTFRMFATAGGLLGLVVTLSANMVAFPVLVASPGVTTATAAFAVLVSLAVGRFIWGRRSRLRRYLDGALTEIFGLHDALQGRAVPVRVTRAAEDVTLRRFAAQGGTAALSTRDDLGLWTRLQVWVAGHRPTGLAMAERLEIHGRDGEDSPGERLQAMARALSRNHLPHRVERSEGQVRLVLETRRLCGSGVSAWHALVAMASDMATPGRIPAHVARQIPQLVEPTSAEGSGPGLPGTRRRVGRGWKHGFAVLSLWGFLVGLPSVPETVQGPPLDFTMPAEAPRGARAARCPAGAGDLYTDVQELACLHEASGIEASLADLRGYTFAELVFPPWFRDGGYVQREDYTGVLMIESMSCVELESWATEVLAPDAVAYVDEWLRRLGRRRPAYVDPAWAADLSWAGGMVVASVRSREAACGDGLREALRLADLASQVEGLGYRLQAGR